MLRSKSTIGIPLNREQLKSIVGGDPCWCNNKYCTEGGCVTNYPYADLSNKTCLTVTGDPDNPCEGYDCDDPIIDQDC